jgi:transcriptional regulator with XRE-family HTH domain
MNTVRALLSANIKMRRKKLGLTQEQLAERVALSSQMLHDIEGQRTWVSDKTLQRLSEALESEIYELLLPPAEGSGAIKRDFRPFLVERLRKTMKAGVDRLLDEFLGDVE